MCPRASGCSDAAPDDEFSVLDDATEFLDRCLDVGGDREDPVNAEAFLAAAHERRVRTRTEEELEAAEHHRLAGSRLAGNDGESGCEVDVS